METAAGSTSGERVPEQIVSVSWYYVGHLLLGNLQYYCLIITEKRILCIRIDDLLAARSRQAPAGPLRPFLFRLFPAEDASAICDAFRAMHPSVIAAAYPGAAVIPVNGVERFEVWTGKHFWCADSLSPASYYWGIGIYGRNSRIQLFTKTCPRDLLENYPLIRLFRGRFFPPTRDTLGWVFGKKTDR